MRRFAVLLVIVLFLAACNGIPTPQAKQGARAALGDAVTLGRGDAVELIGEDLAVIFEDVLSDGRCPEHMSCTATLPVEVALQIRTSDGLYRPVTYSAHTTVEGDVIAGAPGVTPVQKHGPFTISLERVTPYPESRRSIDGSEYAVTIRVTRAIQPEEGTPVPAPVALGAPITAAIGESITVEPDGPRVTITAIKDRRCPQFTACEALPIVVVSLEVEADGAVHQLTFGGVTDNDGHIMGPLMESDGVPWAIAGRYQFELTDVTPYPQPRTETAPEEYRITFVVEERESVPTPAPPSPVPPVNPTPIPEESGGYTIGTTADGVVSVLSIDSAGEPILCTSELALTRFIAGASEELPFAGTWLPIGAISLVTRQAADRICTMFLDDTWRAAGTTDIDRAVPGLLPTSGSYWLWDDAEGAAFLWQPDE